VVPVHLNELSPDGVRGTFPGFVYRLGNLPASVNATLQAPIAGLTALGTEAMGVTFGKAQPA
jgi:SHS family lactate transporter-like MFS transporter